MYARKVFKRESKAQVVEMTDYLRRAFKQILDELEWMDDETKLEAHRKLAQMGQFIAYPDEYLDEKNIEEIYHGLDLDEETYFATLVDINREKNQEEALKVNYFCACFVKYLMSATFVFWDSVYNLFVICVSDSRKLFEGLVWRHDFWILQLCDDLATQYDVIRREYWGYIKRSIQMSKG